MKKFTTLLIGCSLALAGAALAQQPDEQPSPDKKKGAADKTQAAEAKPGAKDAPKSQGAAARQQGGAANAPAPSKGQKPDAAAKPAASATTDTNVSGSTAPETSPAAKGDAQQRGKEMKADAKASPSAAPSAAASTGAAASVAPADQPTGQAKAAATAKKPEPQKVQQIKERHANFRAQPRPQQVPAVTFQQNYRIQGSDRWQGPQYEVYRSYRPERHDEGWYRSRYSRVELIGGGYYYLNSGYWYPAWGFNAQNEYYAYDAPIYVGERAEPPDRVIANVQATLQEMGFYRGEVDGLLGPLTREALTAYQSQQGLIATAVIDQPTLDSLGI
ncbi:MAG TPA: peptidoglycan-binding domain-containing protein [Chthoniobacterales bacterium]|nr:peptidoglycan-binding domain-containing protein [Chthoniobacterales bacterium]